MLEIHGAAGLVDSCCLSLSQSAHLHGIGRAAVRISLHFNLHFMVQPFSNHAAALTSGGFASQWCNHSYQIALASDCPSKSKALWQTAFDCQMWHQADKLMYGSVSDDSEVIAAEGVSACCNQDRVQDYEDYGDGGYSESFQEYCLYARKR